MAPSCSCVETRRRQCLVIAIAAVVIVYFMIDEYIVFSLDINQSDTISYRSHQSHVHRHSHLPHDNLYFANEIALHTDLIGYSYADELEKRKESFASELDSFSSIGRDLLHGNLSTFHHLGRYYVHPSKYHEYTREYLLHKWKDQKINHISPTELRGAHPSCPQYSDALKTYEIHFTHNCCTKHRAAHHRTAKETAHFDHVLHFGYDNVSAAFKLANEDIVSQRRGAGYWIWKPWIVLHTMVNIASACDIVCYCDAGAWWNNTAQPMFELASQVKYGVMVFSHGVSHWYNQRYQQWINLTERRNSKRDALLLLGVDIADMYDTVMRKASFSCYQVNPDAIHFVNEWLYHAQDPRIVTDQEDVLEMDTLETFEENRHDQTVVSLLSKKYGIPAFMDVSQYGYNDAQVYGKHVLNWPYPWIIKHTRGKQNAKP